MKERILKFMEMEQMTAAEFADAIGVQRSSVSHVINGRNNPSSTFIQKILLRFPNIDSRWLLLGEGDEPVSNKGDLFNISPPTSNEKPEVKSEKPASSQNISDKAETDSLIKMLEPEVNSSYSSPDEIKAKHRRISRIVIFYDDKTFSEYFPGE